MTEDEEKARSTIEKKTAINLVEAFAVAIKHYLRNEDSIYYMDLYYLVKFLPEYALPAGRPMENDLSPPPKPDPSADAPVDGMIEEKSADQSQRVHYAKHVTTESSLPFPATTPSSRLPDSREDGNLPLFRRTNTANTIIPQSDEGHLYPAYLPPRDYIFTIFPFSLLMKQSKTPGGIRSHLRSKATSHNIPLEISLYLAC